MILKLREYGISDPVEINWYKRYRVTKGMYTLHYNDQYLHHTWVMQSSTAAVRSNSVCHQAIQIFLAYSTKTLVMLLLVGNSGVFIFLLLGCNCKLCVFYKVRRNLTIIIYQREVPSGQHFLFVEYVSNSIGFYK